MKKGNLKPKKNINIEDVDLKITDGIENNKISNCESEYDKNNYTLFEKILLIVIVALVFSLFGYFIGKKANFANESYSTASKELQKFIEEYNYILSNYYDDINEEELISSAIDGMLTSLDDYSEFVDSNFSIVLEGEYEGLGISVSSNDNEIFISQIYPNSPAEKVGLKQNDIIIKINDESTQNLTTTDLVDKISNLENIKLTILRNNEELSFELKKEIVVLDSVHWEMKEENIGYIKVDLFANNTYEQFKKALKNLEDNNMNGLIIDLRDNGGGHLLAVENILSLFLNETHVIYQTQDKETVEKVYSTGNDDKTYPIVILQNQASASASEIMASALREQLSAYIIGNVSYGKGTIQSMQTIPDIGNYKITTKKWLTSNGIWINETGIVPDLEISLSEDYKKDPSLNNDNQYIEALNYLKNRD